MTLRLLLQICCIVFGCQSVFGWREYQDKIPNGDVVPHPCKPNYQWGGVGHMNEDGGGDRNQFGQDFDAAGKIWSGVCHLDSDGDNITNGEELGDPNCAWTEGDVPQFTANISHPGVCDPFDSPACSGSNTWVNCTLKTLDCPALDEPQTQNVTFRFDRTKVPAQETTLICMRFNLPDTDAYHLVGTKPFIDNEYVMHHIVLFGCPERAPDNDYPGECGNVFDGCSTTLGVWALGMPGECLHEDVGIPFGTIGNVRSVIMQFHWNNPSLNPTHFDESGMTLYFTNVLRLHAARQLGLGQLRLEIPPHVDSHDVSGTCTDRCTRLMFPNPIYVVSIFNHMHYMGRAAVTEHKRNGQLMKELAKEEYNYDSPRTFNYPTPIEIRPGDELILTCTFKSTKDEYTYFGDATSDEMCLTSMTYYTSDTPPPPVVTSCLQQGESDFCDLFSPVPGGCDILEFLNMSNPEPAALIANIKDRCRFPTECNVECAAAVTDAFNHPCLSEQYSEIILQFIGPFSADGGRLTTSINACAHQEAVDKYEKLLDLWGGVNGATFTTGSVVITILALIIA